MSNMNPAPAPTTAPVVASKPSTLNNRNNFIFAIVIIFYEILTLPIYGVLFRISPYADTYYDYGGILLVSITTILLIIGSILLT